MFLNSKCVSFWVLLFLVVFSGGLIWLTGCVAEENGSEAMPEKVPEKVSEEVPTVIEIPEEVPSVIKETGAEAGSVDEIIRRTGEYLKAVKSFGFDAMVDMEIRQGNIIQRIGEEFSLSIERPNRIKMVLKQGVFGPSVVSDGETITTYFPVLNEYLVKESPVSFVEIFSSKDETAMALQSALPVLEAMLAEDFVGKVMAGVEEKEYVGREELNGVECDHVKLIHKDVDFHMWIKSGSEPLLLKVKPDMSRMIEQLRQTQPNMPDVGINQNWQLSSWKVNHEPTEKEFSYQVPGWARKVEQFRSMQNSPSHPLDGQAAPDFELENLEGAVTKLSAHRGKDVVILDFWATWCGPCRAAMPFFSEMARKYKEKGLVLYAVNGAEGAQKVKDFIGNIDFKGSVLLDRDRSVFGSYQVRSIPQTVFIGRDGKVEHVHVGFSPEMQADLESQLQEMLKPQELPKVDLSCQEVVLTPGSVKVGDKVGFSCQVANSGGVEILRGSYLLTLAVDDQQVYAGPGEAAIPAGGRVKLVVDTRNWHFSVLNAGGHRFKVTLDPANKLAETNEDNNTVEGTFEVIESTKK